MRKHTPLAATLGVVLLWAALPASAQVVLNIDIPDTVVCNDQRQPGRPPAGACDYDIGSNTRMTVATTPVPAAWMGASCTVEHVGANGPSTHPNTNLIVTSNGDTVVAYDVERAPGVSTEARGTLTLGDTVTVIVELGGDGVWSGNGNTIVDCQASTTTTTSSTSTTTPSTPPTSTPTPSSSTSTTAPTSSTTTSVPPAPPTTAPTPPPTVPRVPPGDNPPVTTTVVPPVTSPTLPYTGPEGMIGLGFAAAALIGLGGFALRTFKAGRHEA